MPPIRPCATSRRETSHQLTLLKSVQEGLEAVARDAARNSAPSVSVAMVMADALTGEILGEVGSADFFDASRSGWIDMTRALRSPGSTLKPFIYGLAFEEGMVAQETLIEDRPGDFSGYRPRNFDMGYQGDVTIRQALQLSLNVPAVRLLDAVGPARLAARFRQAGVTPVLPDGEAPGLAIGLGGVGLTLRDLVQLYTGLANGGRAKALARRRRGGNARRHSPTARCSTPQAAWQVADILSGVKPPLGRRASRHRLQDRHLLRLPRRLVDRLRRPPRAGRLGRPRRLRRRAGPLRLRSGRADPVRGLRPLRPCRRAAPRAAGRRLRPARDDLPVTLERFAAPQDALVALDVTEPAPTIVFPPEGARVELGTAGEAASPLVLKLQGGRAPFRWLANGKPLVDVARRRTATWQPDGAGYSTLTVIDAAGRAASVKVFVE